MQLDVLDFTKKLLSKCIPVKVRQFKKCQLDSITFEEDSDFSSMVSYHLLNCIKQYAKQCKTSTITSIITPLNTQYYILCLSEDLDEHLMIGPFLENPITDDLVYPIINNLKLNLTCCAVEIILHKNGD